jgi:superfamily II DNA or RNA helicase
MRTVCYCVNVEHSKHTAAAFNHAGIPAVHVDASTTEAELKDACEGLADRRYLVLCNCELVIEGFDLSAQVGRDVTLECCILLRPTMSLARYLQMVFRALRRKPNPAIILDHAGCMMRHGLPCEQREWSLEGRTASNRKAKDEEPDVNIQQCQKCYGVFRPPADNCPHCGAPVERKERSLNEVEGELSEVDMEAFRKSQKMQQGRAQSLKDLVAIGVQRGMKKPAEWACIVYASRQGRKPTVQHFNEARKALGEVRG